MQGRTSPALSCTGRTSPTPSDLTFAHLSGADLTHADLAGSDLTDVRGLRMEQVGSAHITARTVLPPDIGTAAGPSCTT
ncbi:pentapeptide repeat-containing protein [Streptomyces sp. NPDC001118]